MEKTATGVNPHTTSNWSNNYKKVAVSRDENVQPTSLRQLPPYLMGGGSGAAIWAAGRKPKGRGTPRGPNGLLCGLVVGVLSLLRTLEAICNRVG